MNDACEHIGWNGASRGTAGDGASRHPGRRRLLLAGAAAAGLPAWAQPAPRPTPRPPGPAAGSAVVDPVAPVKTTELARGLEHPWGLAFLPDGRMLVTERPGRLRVVGGDGKISPALAGLPKLVARGQGGLLDVAISPDFERDRQVFLSFVEPAEQGSRTAVARATFSDAGLRDTTVIFRQKQALPGAHHFGCRLALTRDGFLFITLGDRYDARDRAQDLGSHFGKIVRIRADGGVPPDNPFVNTPGALPDIWSFGHRNVQGAALHPLTGRLWAHEHGAMGGDELNLVQAGRNFGWPVITHGVDYSGAKIGEGRARPGMEQPLHFWVPSIAPSGMAFVTTNRLPGWRGSLLVGSLKFKLLVRLSLDGEHVVQEDRVFTRLGERVRDVRQGPDGLLYLLTDDSQGGLLRVDVA